MRIEPKTLRVFHPSAALASIQQSWGYWDGICRVDAEPPSTPPSGETTPPPQPDPNSETAIETARKEREARKELEKQLQNAQAQLKAFSGIDPEKAKKAEEILKEMEERSQWESKIRADAEAALQPKLTEYQKQLQEKELALLSYRRDTALEKAFYASGGLEGEFEAIAHGLQGRVQVDNAGNIKVLDEKGQQMYVKGEPATIGDLITDMKEKVTWFARHFRDTSKPGFGVNGTSTNVPAAQLEGLSHWQKVEKARELKGRA